ncbi:carboxylesterase family protein [Variovorax sp. ZS18.2.2]|uniref:carboxylesterase/lipase family protein n=1 Tax=Variovorax sp. ZS18.2.2 TaxID=2971255 RepID=UPI002150F787|nr:carboxylesterase family protein [Variovorax sp. ZS18.2.2]MCR6478216.1 carboxylesterase family protein [Variovorax sp. ZS18.2.2]
MNFRYLSRVVRRASALGAAAVIAAFATVSAPAMAAYDQSLVRSLTDGPIKGKAAANETQAFLGIPFAKPPVGDLRWRAPQPPDKWSSERDATQFASMCAQIGGLFGEPDPDTFGKLVGSEDCLYLNVWRPNSRDEKLPVFFWIHGGGSIMGSAREPIYDGAYLAHQANMVVVTVQYRLGMLGLLRHPALRTGNKLDDSGNFATLDLVRALDWVRGNAEKFGGDPGLVTVAGQSAGCLNTWALLQSPLAEGKLHRALCMSNLASVSKPIDGEAKAEELINRLLIDTTRDLGEAIKQRVVVNLLPSGINSYLLRKVGAEQIMRLTVGGPLTDSVMPGPYADGTVIRSGSTDDNLAKGNYNKVPLMIGSTGEDASSTAFWVDSMGPRWMVQPTQKELWKLINEGDPSKVASGQLIKPGLSQGLFAMATWAGTTALNKLIDDQIRVLTPKNDNIYRYSYNWKDIPQPWKDTFGAFHNSDLAALFGNFVTDEPSFMRFAWTADNAVSRKALSDKFIGYVANFARYGKPFGQFDGFELKWWFPWTDTHCPGLCPKGPTRMIFDNNLRVSSDN